MVMPFHVSIHEQRALAYNAQILGDGALIQGSPSAQRSVVLLSVSLGSTSRFLPWRCARYLSQSLQTLHARAAPLGRAALIAGEGADRGLVVLHAPLDLRLGLLHLLGLLGLVLLQKLHRQLGLERDASLI